MSKIDLGIRKYEESGKLKYWLLVTAKPVEMAEGVKSLKVKFLRMSFLSYYMKLINSIYWNIFIISSIYLNIYCCVSFSWLGSRSTVSIIIIVMHLTCFFYWIDFIGAVIERIIHKKLPKAKPRKYVFLALDMISLIPLSLGYLMIEETPKIRVVWLMRIITLIRFYRIPQFFSRLEGVEKNRQAIIIFAYLSYLIIIIILFANNFIHQVKDYTPVPVRAWNETVPNKIVTSLYYALDIFLNVGSGDIRAVSYVQIIISCGAMTIGFIAIMGFFNGILTTYYVIKGSRREHHRYKYEATMNALKKLKIDKKSIETTKDSLQMLWKYKKGFTEPPPVHVLPLSLQKEIFFDINFGFLNRSIIFSVQPRSFLRSVSLLMKNVTYLPGEVIVESNGQTEAMICVASGVIEILSEENDESVLFSLTTGTILGEAKLFVSIPNRCFIRASTYVELQILKRVSLSRLALTYPQIYKSMRSDIYERLQTTERLIEFEKNKPTLDSDVKEMFRRKETKKFLRNLRMHSRENIYDDMLHKSEILSLYVLSENIPRVKTQPLTLIRARPWILRPDTSLTKVWDAFRAVVVMVSVTAHPVWAAFYRSISRPMFVTMAIIYIVYCFDLYLQCTTAIEKKDHFTYITTVKEIIGEKLKTFTFYLDILSSYYLSIYADLVWPEQADYARLLLSLITLLKVLHVIIYLENLKNNLKNNLLFCVTIKYIATFTIITAWGASLLYLEACPEETCYSDRWFVQKELQAINLQDGVPCTRWPKTMSFYFATVMLFTVGFGDIVPTAISDCVVIILCNVVGTITKIFCVAEISSACKHLAINKNNYQEEIFAVERFMTEHQIPQELQKKVQNYLRLQWDYDEGYSMKQAERSEVLPDIQKRIILMSLTKAFFKVPLFRKANVEFVKLLAKLSKVVVLPPNEYVAEADSYIREMYILENGYCKVSYEKENVEVIMGPGFSFGFLEMILGTHQVINVVTLTHAKVVSLDYISYLKAITKYPNVKDDIDEAIEQDYISPENFYNRVLNIRANVLKDLSTTEQQKEVFQKKFIHVYKYYKNRKWDYWEPFSPWGKFRFFQFLLLPIVITPDCLFLKIWMAMRIVNVLIITTVAPVHFCFLHHMKGVTIFLTLQQAFAAIDLYLMFHVAYYDQRGLLMFHPAKTTTNYLKGTFILDLITVFPYFLVKYLILWVNKIPDPNIFVDVSGSIMVLQLYKFFQGCQYLEKNILRRTELIQILKFIPLSFVLTNCISGFIILLECYEIQQDGDAQLLGTNRLAVEYATNIKKFCLPNAHKSHILDENQIFRLYLTTFYWVMSTITGCGFGDINPQSRSTMISAMIILIVGIFFYTYKFASISSSMVNTNVLITQHKRRIMRMTKFMKEKNVRPSLQKRFLQHYQHDWYRSEGGTPQKALITVNAVLREKIVASMYEETVSQVPVFENVEKIILKIIGKNLNEMYFLGGETIVNYNDIQEHIYLIYRGKVDLFSHYGAMITTMGQGGLFGNISNKPYSLSSEKVIAVGNVDVLRLECKVFFKLLQVYRSTRKLIDQLTSEEKNYIQPRSEINEDKFHSSIIKLNLHYLQKIEQKNLGIRSSTNLGNNEFYLHSNIYKEQDRPFWTFVIIPGSTLYEVIGGGLFVMAYLSVALTMYSFAFQDLSTYIMVLSYGLDIMFAVEILLQFHMAYFNHFGDCVVSKTKIKKKYLNSKKMISDITSNLPLDILMMFSEKNKNQLITSFRMNRIIRLYYIFKYYHVKQKNLMTNKILLAFCWIFLMATLMVHSMTCIWYASVCPLDYCQEPTWVSDKNLLKAEKWDLYIYSVFHIITTATSSGISELPIYSTPELVLDIFFMMICSLCMYYLTSLLVATINVQSLNLFSFQGKTIELKNTFKRQNLSDYIFQKMWNYLKFLWHSGSGKQMPKFISTAPYAMKCELMKAMFGTHLSQSYIFINTNEAFLRQLATFLKRFVYFSGNYIVQQGDIDDTMYFIHKGEVSVLTIHPDLMETIHFVLTDKDNFGIRQGLVRGSPHNFSFRAKTDVEILSLTLDHWQHLLKYFPDVEKIITERLESLPSAKN